jgi:hypothetical protein
MFFGCINSALVGGKKSWMDSRMDSPYGFRLIPLFLGYLVGSFIVLRAGNSTVLPVFCGRTRNWEAAHDISKRRFGVEDGLTRTITNPIHKLARWAGPDCVLNAHAYAGNSASNRPVPTVDRIYLGNQPVVNLLSDRKRMQKPKGLFSAGWFS